MPLPFWDVELLERRSEVPDEHLPVTVANAHACVRALHISSPIVEGAARRRTKKIDKKLLFSRQPIVPAMGPKATQLWIVHQTRHEVVSHGSNGVVSSQSFVEPITHLSPPSI